jgi:hypothetical protein
MIKVLFCTHFYLSFNVPQKDLYYSLTNFIRSNKEKYLLDH